MYTPLKSSDTTKHHSDIMALLTIVLGIYQSHSQYSSLWWLLNKQSNCRQFKTPNYTHWRHCNLVPFILHIPEWHSDDVIDVANALSVVNCHKCHQHNHISLYVSRTTTLNTLPQLGIIQVLCVSISKTHLCHHSGKCWEAMPLTLPINLLL